MITADKIFFICFLIFRLVHSLMLYVLSYFPYFMLTTPIVVPSPLSSSHFQQFLILFIRAIIHVHHHHFFFSIKTLLFSSILAAFHSTNHHLHHLFQLLLITSPTPFSCCHFHCCSCCPCEKLSCSCCCFIFTAGAVQVGLCTFFSLPCC